jgi:hypothetical protein
MKKVTLFFNKLIGKVGQKYYLSFCAIIKNEVPYLLEWIEYHRIMGVEHFYIYDNNSQDNPKELLQPYIKKGIVDYILWTENKGQPTAYRDCIKKRKNESFWIGFIDIDEFVVPVSSGTISEFMKDYEDSNGLGINWLIYGTSGHQKKPDGLTIANYLYRSKDDFPPNRMYKSICNPRRLKENSTGIHNFKFKDNFSVLDSDKQFILNLGAGFADKNFDPNKSKKNKLDKIRINHYFTRSREESVKKFNRGVSAGLEKPLKQFTVYDRNDIYDPILKKYASEIMLRVNKIIDARNKKGRLQRKLGINVFTSNFDWRGYIKLNPDLEKNWNSSIKAKIHWFIFGRLEKRCLKKEEKYIVKEGNSILRHKDKEWEDADLQKIFSIRPLRVVPPKDWVPNIPIAFFLIRYLKPKVFVELGVYVGNSYNAFCQGVKGFKLNTKCYGIDAWRGDINLGLKDNFYIYEELKKYQDKNYSDFSKLIRKNFDEAVDSFEGGSIDLLHIDGSHTYESVKNDFEKWLPKMSDKGVVIFHDIMVKTENFGVHQFWDEISQEYPSLAFKYHAGLGILCVGENVPDKFIQNMVKFLGMGAGKDKH